MLILHTSDWHLGRTLHHADLTPAFELWCDHVVRLVEERHIDAVLISGDIYDRSVPPVSSVELFDTTLERLAQLTTVIMTSGNHDSPRRLGFGAGLMRESVHIRTDSRMSGKPIVLRDSHGKVRALIYPIPYLDPDVERRRLAPHAPGEEPATEDYLERSHEAVLRAALELVAKDIHTGEYADEEVARICMAHAFVTGASPSLSERDLHVGGVDSAPATIFHLGEEGAGSLSYVALGHLHSPQKVGGIDTPPMRYSGSPIAFSFSETSPKSSVLLEVCGSTIRTEIVPAPVWRHVVTLEGTLEELLSQKNRVHATDFVRAVVTDRERPADMAIRIRAAFPYSLEIVHSTEIHPVGPAESQDSEITLDPFETVNSFFESAGNRSLSERERQIAEEIWREARVVREGAHL